MRLRTLAAFAGCVALLGMPVLAHAQTGMSAHDMKGPPNANGFGKNQGMSTSEPGENRGGTEQDQNTSSSTTMKGPPNANGFSK